MSNSALSTTSIVRTPIGRIKIRVSDRGIQEITLDREFNSVVIPKPDKFDDKAVRIEEMEGEESEMHRHTIAWLETFFDATKPQLPAPPIDNSIVSKENFTGLVLRTLLGQTTPGTTVSYAGLAQLCGSPKACRAVGQAMRANPVPLVVPCHRVVASNGGLGHYMSGKGDNIKSWLLELEKQRSLNVN